MFVTIDRPTLQTSLFASDEPAVDVRFAGARRTWLDEISWVEIVPRWLAGADVLFDDLEQGLSWQQRTVTMYDRVLPEPRLVWWWQAGSSTRLPPLLTDMRMLLSIRYGEIFDSVGANYYRDGKDSVAWHRDRVGGTGEATIAIVSTGAPRPFLLRPRGGGASRSFLVGHGDLLTVGGSTNRDWEHTVPKVAHAGPRISLVFRHDSEPIRAAEGSHLATSARMSRDRHASANPHRHAGNQARAANLIGVSKGSQT
jgi:alkylated DNA repair dioxygenase AlkB